MNQDIITREKVTELEIKLNKIWEEQGCLARIDALYDIQKLSMSVPSTRTRLSSRAAMANVATLSFIVLPLIPLNYGLHYD